MSKFVNKILLEANSIITLKLTHEILSEIKERIDNGWGPITDEKFINLIKHPKTFNDGYCHDFAKVFMTKTPGSKYLDTDDCREYFKSIGINNPEMHAFLEINNRFYDIEALKGVDRIEELPFFQRTNMKESYAIS